MARKSSVDRLEPELQTMIADLRARGCTIDEIKRRLSGTPADGISRSALGRHIQGLDKLVEDAMVGREVAIALGRPLEEQDGRLDHAVTQILQAAIVKIQLAARSGEAEPLDVKEVLALAKAHAALAQASRASADRELRVREEAEKRAKTAAAKAVDGIAREKGLTRETIEAIKARILGVKVA